MIENTSKNKEDIKALINQRVAQNDEYSRNRERFGRIAECLANDLADKYGLTSMLDIRKAAEALVSLAR